MDNYENLLEIEHEMRQLVSLDCPIKDWNSDAGYESCARRMGELIDSYKNINNSFNLLIYVDLVSFKEYVSIPLEENRDRFAFLKVAKTFIKQFFICTLIRELEESGRRPEQTLIIFEENSVPTDGDDTTPDGIERRNKYAKEFLGFPEDEKFNSFVLNLIKENPNVTADEFLEKSNDLFVPETVKGVLGIYKSQIDSFLRTMASYDSVDTPLAQMFGEIFKEKHDNNSTTSDISFVTNRRAGSNNKCERVKRDLRLSFFIADCIENGIGKRIGKAFPTLDWGKVCAHLHRKKKEYGAAYREVSNVAGLYHKLGMAPELDAFNNEKFELDEFGNKGVELDMVDVEPTEEEKKKVDEGAPVKSTVKKAVVTSEMDHGNLLSDANYVPFDYDGKRGYTAALTDNPTEEEYYSAAKALRKHHIDYLKRLQSSVADVLARYAGRSLENEEAMLKRRKVSVAYDEIDDEGVAVNYAKDEKETATLNNIKTKAKKAYETVQMEYLRFVAGRSVAVTDIEEQCNWFVTRVAQITESLKRIRAVALGMLIAMIVLYIPYLVVQWEAITKNLLTMLTAAASFAIPTVLLYIVFTFVSLNQRKEYRKEWDKYVKKSDEVIAENAEAVKQYDRLLSFYAPALRFVYEYKLDVEFYESCCMMASAKLGHHRKWLYDRMELVGNIIEDMECDEAEFGEAAASSKTPAPGKIKYVYSFCGCRENREFYSVIDTELLENIEKEDGKR